MSFTIYKFSVTKVFEFKSDVACDLNYSASFNEEVLYVCYDSDDSKKEIFSINGRETINDTLDVNANKGCFIIEANSTRTTASFTFLFEQ